MATQDVEIELQEVLIDTSAADPGPSGRTLVSVCVRVGGGRVNLLLKANELY